MKKRIFSLSIIVMVLSLIVGNWTNNLSVDAAETEEIVWTNQDFTYTQMSQTLNGCDYTREFTVSGLAISGFSEEGEEKFAVCKDVVLPAKTPDGETIIGVADNAFNKKGLTSVKFPEGMMVDYDDTVTHCITKRGNFLIGSASFMGNKLTSVVLPEGVIMIGPLAFKNNQISYLKLPHTFWWLENSAFASNQLKSVDFPKTCDFKCQIHAFAFSDNQIKSVRLPDATEVVEKKVFYFNPGMEECSKEAPEKEQGFGGIVYMYTDNKELFNLERIHHMDRTAESQHSWHQKLLLGEDPNASQTWVETDFTFEGTKITGLSESGIIKRKTNRNLVLPNKNKSGAWITEIADAKGAYGTFAIEGEGFETVELPAKLEKIGSRAFMANEITSIEFPSTLKEIGMAAFQRNQLETIVLPDSVVFLGEGAFATNPKLSKIDLSKNLTVISKSAFGCSDAKNYMTNLTELVIPKGVTEIQDRAFAGNNIRNIVIPEGVTRIGAYAFSTKNYLKDITKLTLPESLTTIGEYAFRNKSVESVVLPKSVNALPANTFLKEYSDGSKGILTVVYVESQEQFEDKTHFPNSQYHKIIYRTEESAGQWEPSDFTYEKNEEESVVTGFSNSGLWKLERNTHVEIPSTDSDGNKIIGIKTNAFKKGGIKKLSIAVADDISSYCIGKEAFAENDIEELELPEIGGNKFVIEEKAFSKNQLIAVSIPDHTDVIAPDAFLFNKGVEKVDSSCTEEYGSKSGVVYLYNSRVDLNDVDEIATVDHVGNNHSWVQKFVFGMLPDAQKPWQSIHFESEDGVILGLSDAGKAKVEQGEKSVQIPSVDGDGKAIVKIGADAFADEKITNVAFPKSIEIIDDRAFENVKLDEVKLPVGLKELGERSFAGVNLKYLCLPDSVDRLAETAFENAEKEPVTLFSGRKEHLNETAQFCPKSKCHQVVLDQIVGSEWTFEDFLYEGNEIIGWSDRGNQTRLRTKKLVLPEHNPITLEKITKIGDHAFEIPEGEWIQGKDSVESPNGMKTVLFPKTLTEIGVRAFRYNALSNIDFPNTLTTIGESAFNSNQLEKVIIPDSVTTLEAGAFSTNHITELTLSKNLTEITQGAFAMNITMSHVELPAGIKKIGDTAFAGARLEQLEIPKSVESIGRKAFHLHHLTNLTIPGNVKEIGDSAFEGTFKKITLQSLVIEEGVEKIGAYAFKEGYLQKVVLPFTLKELADNAFFNNEGINNDHVVLLTTGNRAFAEANAAGDGQRVVYELHDVSGNVPINDRTFPDINFREYVIKNVDLDRDGILSQDEREKNTNISDCGATDLTQGLEYFSNLSELHVGDSPLKKIDVSSNKKLTFLEVFYTNLEEVDVTNNPELVRLDCCETRLNALDVTKNPKLFALNVENTNLTSLDVTKNPKLYEVYICGTKIDKLDVTKNPDLTHIRISDTNLTSIDLTKNQKLAALMMNHCKIAHVDLSKNPNLYEVFCYGSDLKELNLAGKTKLNVVECYDTEIDKLDISSATKLAGLSCSNTKITNLDLKNNVALKRLECANTKLTRLDLSKNTNLTHLNISNTNIENLKNLDVSKFHLRELYCSNAGIESIKFEPVPMIYSLKCEQNHITELNMSKFPELWFLKDISLQSRTVTGYLEGENVIFDLHDIVSDISKVNVPEGEGYQYDAKSGIVKFLNKEDVHFTYTYDHGYSKGDLDALTVVLHIVYQEEEKPPVIITQPVGKLLNNPTANAVIKVVNSGTVDLKNKTVVGAEATYVRPMTQQKSVYIPDTIKNGDITYKIVSIEPSAFKNHKKMTTVTIGANITKIGKYAFYGCKKLKNITIKSNRIYSVGKKAFYKIHKKAVAKVPKIKKKAYKKFLKKVRKIKGF